MFTPETISETVSGFFLYALDFPFYYRASGYVLNSVIEARHARNDG